jgi:hypothetical protein
MTAIGRAIEILAADGSPAALHIAAALDAWRRSRTLSVGRAIPPLTEADSVVFAIFCDLVGSIGQAYMSGGVPPIAAQAEARRLGELFGLAGAASRVSREGAPRASENPYLKFRPDYATATGRSASLPSGFRPYLAGPWKEGSVRWSRSTRQPAGQRMTLLATGRTGSAVCASTSCSMVGCPVPIICGGCWRLGIGSGSLRGRSFLRNSLRRRMGDMHIPHGGPAKVPCGTFAAFPWLGD